MCISVGADGKHLGTCGELADWLGVPVSELTVDEDSGWGELQPDWCLCPVDVDHTLDRFKIWHRCDLDRDSMRTLAMRDDVGGVKEP